MVLSISLVLLAWFAGTRLIKTHAAASSWLLNHLILLAAFVVLMQSLGQALLGLWRLRGLRAGPIVDQILLSRTPAEFWRRWSWPIHLWLMRYAYEPCGGRAHHVRATLATFLASGLLHEALVVIAIGRPTGHQTAFFMLSALGVLASPPLLRLSRTGIVGQFIARAVTITFLAATASLMFITFNYLMPIYAQRIRLMW
jgi:hypothetical protein